MPTESRIVSPGPDPKTVRTDKGAVLQIPPGWELLPPGDAGVTRRVKARGPSWTVKEKKGRRTFSKGVWAPADRIAIVQAEFKALRGTEAYAKKQASAAKRRDKKQAEYVEDFNAAVISEAIVRYSFQPTTFELYHRSPDDLASFSTGRSR